MFKTFIASSVLAATACMLAPLAMATVNDAASDFSSTSNPNGPWSYGSTGASLTGPFSLFDSFNTDNAGAGNLQYWHFAGSTLPLIGKTSSAGYGCCGTVSAPPNTLEGHPGSAGAYADLRYTAPSTDTYQISASFWGNDYAGPTTADVHVHLANGDIFTANVNGYGPSSTQSYMGTIALTQGDVLDFAIGYGNDGSFRNDSTGFSAVITSGASNVNTAVPEPASVTLFGLGLFGFAVLRRKSAK